MKVRQVTVAPAFVGSSQGSVETLGRAHQAVVASSAMDGAERLHMHCLGCHRLASARFRRTAQLGMKNRLRTQTWIGVGMTQLHRSQRGLCQLQVPPLITALWSQLSHHRLEALRTTRTQLSLGRQRHPHPQPRTSAPASASSRQHLKEMLVLAPQGVIVSLDMAGVVRPPTPCLDCHKLVGAPFHGTAVTSQHNQRSHRRPRIQIRNVT
mmetsp:Transcript_144985/g.361672  ORF Transcript_144985/g.361672 Transcript_144985/m.361672 type:complete len:210 (-) Transcript_144985:448-1077(-)